MNGTFNVRRGMRPSPQPTQARQSIIVTPRHAHELGIAQEPGQLICIRSLIPITDRDKGRDGDLTQRILTSRDERVQHVQQGLRVSANL